MTVCTRRRCVWHVARHDDRVSAHTHGIMHGTLPHPKLERPLLLVRRVWRVSSQDLRVRKYKARSAGPPRVGRVHVSGGPLRRPVSGVLCRVAVVDCFATFTLFTTPAFPAWVRPAPSSLSLTAVSPPTRSPALGGTATDLRNSRGKSQTHLQCAAAARAVRPPRKSSP